MTFSFSNLRQYGASARVWPLLIVVLCACNPARAEWEINAIMDDPSGVQPVGTGPVMAAATADAPIQTASIADPSPVEITNELKELVRGLRNDPVAIYTYVRNNIAYQAYTGSCKGATGTYLDGAGNDTDQASLLIALLRASDTTISKVQKADYCDFSITLPATSPDGKDMRSWLGLTDSALIGIMMANAGIPNNRNTKGTDSYDDDVYTIKVTGVAVTLAGASKAVYLLPCAKASQTRPGLGITALRDKLHFDRDYLSGLVSGSGNSGTLSPNAIDEVTAVDLLKIEADFNRMAGDLMANLKTASECDKSIEDLMGGSQVTAKRFQNLEACNTENNDLGGITVPSSPETYPSIDNNKRALYSITVDSNSATQAERLSLSAFTDSLAGRSLGLAFTPEKNAQLILDGDTVIATQPSHVQTTANLVLSLSSTFNNILRNYTPVTIASQRTGLYDLTPTLFPVASSSGAYDRCVRLLANGVATNKSSQWQTLKTLQTLALKWSYYCQTAIDSSARLCDGRAQLVYIFGRSGQDKGYFVDMPACFAGISIHLTKDKATGKPYANQMLRFHSIVGTYSLLASAFEHQVVHEQAGIQAVSTVECLYQNLVNGTKIRNITPSNLSVSLSGIDAQSQALLISKVKNETNSTTNENKATIALWPMAKQLTINDWTGQGYLVDTRGDVGSSSQAALITGVDGVLNGGASTKVATITPKDTVQNTINAGPINVQPNATTSPEPVDLATGNYISDANDMVVGDGALPTGITFSRHYDSSRHTQFDGIGNGWTHSFSSKIARSSDVYRAFGRMQPTDAVRTLTGLVVAASFHSSSAIPTAKERVLALLATRWSVEHMYNNVATLSVGKDQFVFVAAPAHPAQGIVNRAVQNFTTNWNPGPGIQAELIQTKLTETVDLFSVYPRSGGVIKLDSQNRVSSVSDADDRTATYSYRPASDTDPITSITVTDCYTRSITAIMDKFTDGTLYVSKVTGPWDDGASREVSFTYPSGALAPKNLIEVVDPVSNSTYYQYDSANRLEMPQDHKRNPLTKNFYDTQGRVKIQWSQNDPTHEWNFLYSPGQTIQLTPKAEASIYLFDRWMRKTGEISPSVVALNPSDILGQATVLTYNTRGQVVRHQDADGAISQMTYDLNGNITEALDAENQTTKYAYYPDFPFQLHTLTTPGNICTTYTYEGSKNEGRLKTVSTPGQGTTTYTYINKGDIESIVSAGMAAADNKVTFSNYEKGKPKNVAYTPADGSLTAIGAYKTSFEYYVNGDIKTSTDRRNKTTTYTYDKRRLPLTTEDANSKLTKTEYDCNGYLWKVTDANQHVVETNYDNLGHLLNTKADDTGTVVYTLDIVDRVKTVTDGLNHSTSFCYDADGRQYTITNALNKTVSTTLYTNTGRVKSSTDARNHTTQFNYDKLGRLKTSTDPLLAHSDTVYSPHGARSSYTDRRNKTYTWNFDSVTGLEKDFVYPSATRKVTIAERYPSGLPKKITTSSGTNSTKNTEFTYTCTQALLEKKDSVGTITYTPATATTPEKVSEKRTVAGVESTRTITRELTNLNQLQSCTDSNNNQVSYLYDDVGNVKTLTYPDGFSITYTYDGANRLRTIMDSDQRRTVYEYDLAGRLLRVYRHNMTVCVVKHDVANQLESTSEQVYTLVNPAELPSLTNANLSSISPIWKASYVRYDDGKMQTYKPFPGTLPNIPAPASMTFNDDGQLQTFNGTAIASSLDGNLSRVPLAGSMTNLTWDARNRLEQFGAVALSYDAENRRMTKTEGGITSTYVYNRGKLDQLLMVKRSDGSFTRYVHGRGLVYEINYDTNGLQQSVHYYHYDWRGNTMALTNQSATVVARWGYTAFGDETQVSGTATTPFRFNGQWGVMTDAPGLLCMQARFYSTAYHRFLCEDPSGFAGGSNWYAYANGDPINMMDPFGLGAIDANNSVLSHARKSGSDGLSLDDYNSLAQIIGWDGFKENLSTQQQQYYGATAANIVKMQADGMDVAHLWEAIINEVPAVISDGNGLIAGDLADSSRSAWLIIRNSDGLVSNGNVIFPTSSQLGNILGTQDVHSVKAAILSDLNKIKFIGANPDIGYNSAREIVLRSRIHQGRSLNTKVSIDNYKGL